MNSMAIPVMPNLPRDSNISWSTVSKAVDRSCYQSREGPADGRYQCCDICGLINFVKTVKYQVLQQLRSYYPLRCFRDKVNMRLDTGLKLGSTSSLTMVSVGPLTLIEIKLLTLKNMNNW